MNDNTGIPHKLNSAMELIRALNVSNLQQLQTFLAKEIHERGAEERRTAILQIHAIAQASGIDLRTLAAKVATAKTARKPIGPAPALYANPADTTETWSGRGRTPRWLRSQLDAGEDISKFKIAA